MPKVLDEKIINERSRHLLKVLVNRYIHQGQPVGSRTLSRDPELEFSPATIRNIMSDLEDAGLIHAPHTSAGRIPTARGYRLFIDSLLQTKPPAENEVDYVRGQLLRWNDEKGNQDLLQNTSSLLSELTHLAGIVMLPRHNSQALRHVEFLSLSDNRVLVVLVLNEQEVQNRIIHTSRLYTEAELQEAANYLNAAFAGKDISQVRNGLICEMRDAQAGVNRMMRTVIEIADKAFSPDEQQQRDFLLAGQNNLMDAAELASLDKLKELFDVFTQKQDILLLLDQALNAERMQIFVGEESGYQSLDQCSIIAAPYDINGITVGVLGVIGPTRMPYARLIPLVDITAQLLGATLGSLNK